MLSLRILARELRKLHSNYPRILPAARMDAGVDVNEGSDTDSEKAKSTSVDGGPPEENGTTTSPLASADDAESRATGPEPSSGSPVPERSRHTKTPPPSKASGRGWMPPLKKFFSTDSWFRKKQGRLQALGVSLRHVSLPFVRNPGENTTLVVKII